ncbi:hypothetical protein HK097_001614 [Rhizophlyctis rosea]|uniref:TOG domain-containing protein n=1 Tax=Rhizophlyctis rosea TaxID=64517 RepID=A0AAD5X1S0_9FUNG|nr:hypothetical protein HK097_001614 [Rhizophlyctis rosea]
MTQALPPILNEDTINAITTLLAHLTSPDNSLRAPAEEQLNNQLLSRSDILLSGLAYIASRHAIAIQRSFAAVLLRKLAPKEAPNQPQQQQQQQQTVTYFMLVGEDVRSFIYSELLNSLRNEQDKTVRRKVNDTVAELARHMLERGSTWTQLVHATFELLGSPNADHRSSALRIWAQVPGLIHNSDIEQTTRFLTPVLKDADVEVRLDALKTSVAYITSIEDERTKQKALGLVTEMLNVLPGLKDDDERMTAGLGCLVDIAEWAPKMLKQVLGPLVQFVVGLMKDGGLGDGTKQTALELLLTFAEALPGAARKSPEFVRLLVPVLLEWMADIDEEQSWYQSNGEDDDDADANYMIASQALDRLALALGGKTLLPPAFDAIPRMLGDQAWPQRHAGLMAISAIAEGCAKIMEQELGRIMGLVLPYLGDGHPRVRWAAANCVGQLSTDFAPTMQNQFAQQVLNALVPVMDDVGHPRVQAHAAAALVNFCEEMTAPAIAPYLEEIFKRLMGLLQNRPIFVQEQAITTIATVADSAEKGFVKYYGEIMPLLINVLRETGPQVQSGQGKEFRLLRGKTVECATLIALAVGKETFAPQAHELIQLLRDTQLSIKDDDDPQSSYLLAGWARVCKVMGAEFAPMLGTVMEPLMRSARLRPEFVQLEDEEDLDKYDEGEGWEFVEVDGKKLAIKNAVLDEKCTAVEMFICYARELGAGFADWCDKIFAIVVPLLKFYFHEDVRHAACAVLPLLFRSLVLAGRPRDQVLTKWFEVGAQLIAVLKEETEPGFLCQGFVSIQETVEILGQGCMTPELLNGFVAAADEQLKQYVSRIEERKGARTDQDHDPEDEEVLQDEEEGDDLFLSELSKALHEILKAQGETFLPFFENLLPTVGVCMTRPEVAPRQFALCVWDDIIEFGGPSVGPRYGQTFMQPLLHSLHDESHEVRQAAAYGIGVAAQTSSALPDSPLHQMCAQSLQGLIGAIRRPDGREEENLLATENCVSALGKICKFLGGRGFDTGAVLVEWVKELPVLVDEEEVAFVYGYLLELVESGNPSILGPQNDGIPKLVSIFVEVLATPGLVDVGERVSLGGRIVEVLKGVLAGCGDDVRGAIWNGLSPERRHFLQAKGFV